MLARAFGICPFLFVFPSRSSTLTVQPGVAPSRQCSPESVMIALNSSSRHPASQQEQIVAARAHSVGITTCVGRRPARSRDSQPISVGLACKCRMRINQLAAAFAGSAPRTASGVDFSSCPVGAAASPRGDCRPCCQLSGLNEPTGSERLKDCKR